jgi:hypothetical protein
VCLLLATASLEVFGQSVRRNECASPPAGAIFCEDFEGANPKANFNDYDGNTDSENQVVVETGPNGDSQNRAVRLRAPAGQSGGADLVKVLPSRHDRLFARWLFKYEPGFNFAALNHGGGLSAGDRNFIGQSGNKPAGNDFAGFYVQYQENTARPYAYSYYRGMYQDCRNAQGSCWGDSLPCVYDSGQGYCTKPQHRPTVVLPTMKAGQWYCVEQMLDMGTPTTTGTGANGRLTLWLDGLQLGDFTDLWIRTTSNLQIQNFWLSLFHHDATHSTAGELVDNVVVSTQRIGCGAPSTLAAPTNLRIVQ